MEDMEVELFEKVGDSTSINCGDKLSGDAIQCNSVEFLCDSHFSGGVASFTDLLELCLEK